MSDKPTRLEEFEKQTTDLENEITQMPDISIDKGFLNTLFKNDEGKKVAETQLSLVTCQLEYRRKALVMYSNLRIEELRKYCESEAQRGGMEINVQTEMYIRELVASREVWANAEVDKFLANYESANVRMEQITIDEVKEKEASRLEKTLDAFYDTIDYFNEEFKKSLAFQADQMQI